MVFLNLAGRRFGRYVVLERRQNTKQGKAAWLCRCDCGKEKVVVGSSLLSGLTTSCGCYSIEKAQQRAENLKGRRFGSLLVLSQDVTNKDRHITWRCACDCGQETTVAGSKLKSGHTKSCGCLQKYSNFKHGLTGTREIKRVYEKRRRDKEKILNSDWTLEHEHLLFSIFRVCVICGGTDRLCVDHVIPLSCGGRLEPGNAVVLCRSCNSKKRDRNLSSLSTAWQEKIKESANIFKNEWERQTCKDL